MFNDLLEKIFIRLLRWYSNKRLDQWERWELESKHGPVFITLSRESDGYHYDELK